jgi:hypothetical protein
VTATRAVQPVGDATTRQAVCRELEEALKALQAESDGPSGPSGFRAMAIAHVRKALLYLRSDNVE